MKITVEQTSDSSPTLYREDIDEHYHSVKGALAESRHVYVDLGWRKAAECKEIVNVFEVGFGTGLNAALTANVAEYAGIPTIYHAVELYPLSMQIIESLLPSLPDGIRQLVGSLNEAEWNKEIEISPWFKLVKIEGNLLTTDIACKPDVVYFDAFAPEKQPEMWDESIFRKLYEAMSHGGVLTTYCAKGAIRRMLASIGFITERLPGPPAGKREVLRVTKP